MVARSTALVVPRGLRCVDVVKTERLDNINSKGSQVATATLVPCGIRKDECCQS